MSRQFREPQLVWSGIAYSSEWTHEGKPRDFPLGATLSALRISVCLYAMRGGFAAIWVVPQELSPVPFIGWSINQFFDPPGLQALYS